jgi:hypothetical protein
MIFLRRLNILLPALQLMIWQGSLILGFALLYLAIELQNRGEISAAILLEHFLLKLWLSCAISFRLFFNNLILEDSMIFLVANIQFYLGFLFYGFLVFYVTTLKQKARQLLPRLYNLKDKFDDYYSPSILYGCLSSYSQHNLMLILDDWQQWAETLKSNFNANPHLIFRPPGDNRMSWLAGLNIVLDSSATLIIGSDEGAVKRQARRTFGAVRRALVEAKDLLNLLLEQNDAAQTCFHQKNNKPLSDFEDEVLTAEFIFEAEDCPLTKSEIEMFEDWQFTYKSLLRDLADYLDADIPSRRRL